MCREIELFEKKLDRIGALELARGVVATFRDVNC